MTLRILGWCQQCGATVPLSSTDGRVYTCRRGHPRTTAALSHLAADADAVVVEWPPPPLPRRR